MNKSSGIQKGVFNTLFIKKKRKKRKNKAVMLKVKLVRLT